MRFAGGSRGERDCRPVHLNAVVCGTMIGSRFGVRPPVPFNAEMRGMVIGVGCDVRPTVPFNAEVCGMVIDPHFVVRPTDTVPRRVLRKPSGRLSGHAGQPCRLSHPDPPSQREGGRPTWSTAAGPSQPNPGQGRLTPELSGRPHNAGLGAVLAADRGDFSTAWTSIPEHV